MTNAIASLVKQNANAVAAHTEEKKAAKRPAAVKKASTKPASKAKTVASTKAAAVLAIKYRVVSNRAASGPLLWAHTAAWLELSGMLSGKSFSKKAAQNVAGNTAIAYHLQKGTFEQVGDKIKLTAGGKHHFKSMVEQGKIDPEQKDAYIALMKTGKTQAAVSVNNKAQIGAMPE